MEERHAGDLGNIEANADGVSEGSMEDSILTLIGEHTIIGRSMMVCLEHSSVVMFHYS
jgi:Cu-Zn family superoxide dismutase